MACLGLLTKEMSVDLFIRPDGKAMLFWMSSSSTIETHIKTLVEARGGVLLVDDVSSDNSENVIRLVEETVGRPACEQYEYFSCKYIFDCVKEERILPNLREYKIFSGFPYGEYDPLDVLVGKIGWSLVSKSRNLVSNIEQIDEDVEEDKVMAEKEIFFERVTFRDRDGKEIEDGFIKCSAYRLMRGNVTLEKTLEIEILRPSQSWQSMKEHFKKLIGPSIVSYELTDDQVNWFCSGTGLNAETIGGMNRRRAGLTDCSEHDIIKQVVTAREETAQENVLLEYIMEELWRDYGGIMEGVWRDLTVCLDSNILQDQGEMTEQLPGSSALPISLLRKESNCPIAGRERKRRLCDLNERELFLESPEKPNNQIVNYEEEFTGKPREKRRSGLNINNTEKLLKGLDEESTITPIFSHSLYELPHYIDKNKLDESSVDPYIHVYKEEVMTEEISEVEEDNDFPSVFNNWTRSSMEDNHILPRVKQIKSKDDRMTDFGLHSQSRPDGHSGYPDKCSIIGNYGGTLIGEAENQSKMLRKPYSVEEESAIIQFLTTKGGYSVIRGQRIWKEMEIASICPGRSGQALREHFLKHTFKRLESFQVTKEQLQNCDDTRKHTTTFSTRSYDGGKYHGLRGFRPTAKYYTEVEDLVILKFVVNNGHEEIVGGNNVWKLMMKKNILKGRTWQSMKARFRKSILKRLDFFDLTLEQREKLVKSKRKRRKSRKICI